MESKITTLLTGPLLLGYIFNSFLYGIELLQFYRYHISFPEEKAWLRRLVYTVVLLDTLQTAFTIHDAWRILGAGWGDPTILTQRSWTFGSVPLFTGLVSLLVQGCYAHRVNKLLHSRWIVALILTVAAGQCICGVFAGISYVFESQTIEKRILAWVTTVWLGGTALCDLIISTTIVTFLMIKIAGFTPTDNVVSKVICMTVEIGAVTTSAATADLILFLAYPSNNLHMIFCIPLAKLYSNCLLAMLNARNSSFAQGGSSSNERLPTSIRQTKQSITNKTHSPQPSHSTQFSEDFDFGTTSPKAKGPVTDGTIERGMQKPSSSSSPFTIPPRPIQPVLGSGFISPHKRTESTQHLTAPSQASIAMSKAPRRPTKLQANADFDDLYPSHLDLSNDNDTSLRSRLFDRFKK